MDDVINVSRRPLPRRLILVGTLIFWKISCQIVDILVAGNCGVLTMCWHGHCGPKSLLPSCTVPGEDGNYCPSSLTRRGVASAINQVNDEGGKMATNSSTIKEIFRGRCGWASVEVAECMNADIRKAGHKGRIVLMRHFHAQQCCEGAEGLMAERLWKSRVY